VNNGDFRKEMTHAIAHLNLEKALHKSLSHHCRAKIYISTFKWWKQVFWGID